MKLAAALSALSVMLVGAREAVATYSVVATDSATRQVGGAVTSCVGSNDVSVVFGASPGHGGINAQAARNAAGGTEGVRLLAMDRAPADIIAAITAASFDANAATRQYGIADLSGRAAGFTGTRAMDYKEDRQGALGAFTYSVQGNILTSRRVLDQAEAAFRGMGAPGCDLAERLMLGLEGGAMNGEGDSRCTGPKMIPSDSASIEVDPEGMVAGSYLKLSVRGTGNTSPLVSLRAMFNTWRATHPCGGGSGGGGAPGTGGRNGSGGAPATGGRSGSGGAVGSTGGATATGGAPASGGAVGSTGGAPASGGAVGSTGGAPITADGGAAGAGEGSGCSCAVGGGGGGVLVGAVVVVLAAVAFGRRRRR